MNLMLAQSFVDAPHPQNDLSGVIIFTGKESPLAIPLQPPIDVHLVLGEALNKSHQLSQSIFCVHVRQGEVEDALVGSDVSERYQIWLSLILDDGNAVISIESQQQGGRTPARIILHFSIELDL